MFVNCRNWRNFLRQYRSIGFTFIKEHFNQFLIIGCSYVTLFGNEQNVFKVFMRAGVKNHWSKGWCHRRFFVVEELRCINRSKSLITAICIIITFMKI